MTGGSASYFGEQYRDLLLDLYQKLDENSTRWWRGYTVHDGGGDSGWNPDVVRLPASSRSTGRRQVGSHERFSEHVENDGHLNKQL